MEVFGQLSDLLQEKAMGWLNHVVGMLPRYLVGIVVLLIFYLFARWAKILVFRLLNRSSRSKAINNFVSYLIGVMVFLAGLFIALDIVKLDKTFTSLLAGAGILGLAFSLGFQDVVANLVSSFMIATRKPYTEGDLISSNGEFGRVVKINMRSTYMRSPSGELVIIPNRMIYQNVMKNYSEKGVRRIELSLCVDYGSRLNKVKATCVRAIEEKFDGALADKEVEFFFTKFGEYAVHLMVRYWVSYRAQKDYWHAVSQGIEAISAYFEKEGISIPYPVKTIEIEDVKRSKND